MRDAASERWAAWAASIGRRLGELAERREPTYADIAETFALCWGGTPDADPWAECRHARLKTRQALEREAARYDRYAARLEADGVPLRHPTALGHLTEDYAVGRGMLSPGAALTRLGQISRELRRRWHELHPDVKERRRRERVIRTAIKRNETPPRIAYRVAPRRPAHYEDGTAEIWRRWGEWREGETWYAGLVAQGEAEC